ncbi:lonely Cys domain-containing protein, partial [Streptomyces sp. TRM76130]|nr:lonely Cys domain-containing protein [Streptomyces sp. TRM76130]
RGGADLASRPQPAADPLTDVPTAQTVANGTRKRVRAVDRPAGHHNDAGDTSHFWLEAYTDARGRGGRVREFRPEPSDGELAAHARTAGLHTGTGPVPAETTARTLRLVRALRLTLGPGIDDDPSYGDLLRGIGALETMRQADPALLGTGPFTMDLFERVALAELRDHGGGPGPVDATAYRNLLARAAAAPHGTPLSRFARVPQLVGVAQLTRNLKDLPATTRSVLRLDAAEPVGEAELSRLYWAQVKAVEWLNGLPDVAGTAALILH